MSEVKMKLASFLAELRSLVVAAKAKKRSANKEGCKFHLNFVHSYAFEDSVNPINA